MTSRQQQMLSHVVAWVASWFLWVLFSTLRPVVIGQAHLDRLIAAKTPFVAAFWHGRILGTLNLAWHYRHLRVTVMVSRSRDGEFISRVSERFGIQPTRGSSSRGGSRAVLEMIRRVKAGYIACFTPDGPRGPRYRVQPGVITVAQKTGTPILPVTYSAEWKKVFRSWDRFMVPLPFSRLIVVYGEPIAAPALETPESLQAKQCELESSLRQLTEMADDYFKTSKRVGPDTEAGAL